MARSDSIRAVHRSLRGVPLWVVIWPETAATATAPPPPPPASYCLPSTVPFTIYCLPSTAYRLPSTAYRLPSRYRLLSTVYRFLLPMTYQLPSTFYCLPSTSHRPSFIAHKPPTANRPPSTVHRPPPPPIVAQLRQCVGRCPAATLPTVAGPHFLPNFGQSSGNWATETRRQRPRLGPGGVSALDGGYSHPQLGHAAWKGCGLMRDGVRLGLH